LITIVSFKTQLVSKL